MKKFFYTLFIFSVISISIHSQTPTLYINKTDGTCSEFPLSTVESITFTSNGDIVLSDGLIAYYPFNGNANDEWGSNNGTPTNGAELTQDKSGNSNSAYLFDGLDDYIALDTYLQDLTELSVSVWVMYTKPSNQVGDIIVDTDVENGNDFRLDMRETGIGITANKSGALLNACNGNAISDLSLKDAWHHIVWTMSSTQSKIYLDGTLMVTKDVSGSNVGHHSDKAVIGCYYAGAENTKNFFQGKIDNLRIYNRVLDAGEVSILKNLK